MRTNIFKGSFVPIKMKAVYILPNGKALDSGEFKRYFEKKVLYTVRKFSMPREVKVRKRDCLNDRVLLHLIERFGFMGNSKITAISDSADDVASGIVESWFENRKVDLSPSTRKEIRPLFLMTDQEISIYASLKGIKGKQKKKSSARNMLDKMEKPHPEIKRAIVQSYIQLLEIQKK